MQTETIQIRPIQASDLAAFRELRLEALLCHPQAFSADYQLNLDRPISYWQERIDSNLANPRQCIFVAAAGDALVGMTGIMREESPKTCHYANIWGVYVKASHRGLGLGERLMNACQDWAAEGGVRFIRLGVAVSNTPAVRCYQRAGYTIYGTEPASIHYQGQDIDEYLMVLKL